MTTTQVPTAGSRQTGLEEGANAAAEAMARVLPADQTLRPGSPMAGSDLDPTGWPAGAVATLSTGAGASVGVLMRADLADALASAPSGGLDLAAAVQPALDAAAAALGAAAGAGRSLRGPDLAGVVANATIAVPLMAGPDTAAVLLLSATGSGTVTHLPSGDSAAAMAAAGLRGVELLHGVAMEVTVELGRTRMSVRELLALVPGDVLELDRAAGSPADLLVNGRLIARGEVVVVDEDFALRVTEIVAQTRTS
jgi:flagellar motor switch protein FliN/FliY